MATPDRDTNRPAAGMDFGTRRSVIAGSTLSAGVVLVGALLVFANYFGFKYHQRFDWTQSKLYTLSEKSKQVVAEMTADVEAIVFLPPSSQLYEQVKELLARYEAASPRIKVREVDPEKNLAEAQSLVDKYQVSSLKVVVFDSGTDRRVVEEADLADYDYSGMQFGQGPTLTEFKGEQKFTAAILELTQNAKPKILFTTGHGERSIDDQGPQGMALARDLVGRDNVTVEEWASLGQAAVPDGTDLVVVAGPTASFVQPELDMLGRYVDAGGRLLVLLDPTLRDGALAPTGLEPWLANYGVAVGTDIVVDPSNPLPFFGAETIFASAYGAHPITRALSQANVPSIFALARSVKASGGTADLERVDLVRTSGEGWGETNLVDVGEGQVRKDPEDLAGPVSLAVAVAPKGSAKQDEAVDEFAGEEETDADADAAPSAEPTSAVGRIVVFGDSDFATNGQINNVGNPNLLANTINWLLERESLLGIAAKTPEQVRLNLTAGQVRSVYLLVLLVMPALAIGLGIVVWLRRRR